MTSLPAGSPGVAILANPFAGSGPNRRYVDRLIAALKAHNLEPRLVWDRQQRRQLLADPALDQWCRCVVSAGGDGSLADVLNEMAGPDSPPPVPVAMLPIGTENLFARQFRFTLDPVPLAKAIAAGRTRRIDLGCAGNRLFSLMISSGFDADVVHRLDRWRRRGSGLRRVSRLSYPLRMLVSARQYPFAPVRLHADGRTITGAHAFVFNLPRYGINLNIAPAAEPDDGLLDWVVFEKPGLATMAGYLISVWTGRHLKRPDVHHGRARTLRIEADPPAPLQADGDPAGTTPVTVRPLPGALPLVAVDA